MGLVKYGGGIVQICGSIAGTVFSRNKSGNYVRPRTKPVNPHSDRQEAARAIISNLAEYWHQELTAVQRNLWQVYADAVAMHNKLSETIHLSGFNHFLRCNSVLAQRGQPASDAAPTVLSLPERDTNLHVDSTVIATQKVTVHVSTDGWAADGDTKGYEHVYMGKPQLASRNTFHGPWRYMGCLNTAQGAGGFLEMDASYAFAEGQRFWLRSRIETLAYRVSTFAQSDGWTVIADP